MAFLSGIPAGLGIDRSFIDRELLRWQQGFDRGGRMTIETGKAPHRFRRALWEDDSSTIAILLENKDWTNWQESSPVAMGDRELSGYLQSQREIRIHQ